MAFYITPPGGNISLQKLTHYAVTRLKFLFKVMETDGDRLRLLDVVRETETVINSECLIEGSVKDKISHFMLRLAAFGEPSIRSFLVTAETLLFDFRFSCMTADELCRLLRSLDSHIHSQRSNNQSQHSDMFQSIMEIFSQIKQSFVKWKTLVIKYLSGEADCCFHVPFQTVPQLVAMRQVTLHGGIASVPVCRLREVVTSLFRDLLLLSLQARPRFQSEDERMRRLVRGLKVLYHRHYPGDQVSITEPGNLSHTEVDRIMTYFPPCMLNAHRVLRQKHRLKHHTRIQYTLFLKEAGLPVHEALMFWRKEYSMSPSNHDGCSHNWSRDERRYTYNIRHLYGLEGSRINYRGHSCVALQENFHGTTEEGGCPFNHFDSAHLSDLLATEGIHDNHQQHILEIASSGKCSQACQLFFKYKAYSTILADHQKSSVCGQSTSRNHYVSTDGVGSCSSCKQSSVSNTVTMETCSGCRQPSLKDGVIIKTGLPCACCKQSSLSNTVTMENCSGCWQPSLKDGVIKTGLKRKHQSTCQLERTKESCSIDISDCKQRTEHLHSSNVNKPASLDMDYFATSNSKDRQDGSAFMHCQQAVVHDERNTIIKHPENPAHQCNEQACSKQFEEMDQDQGIPPDADNEDLGPFCVKCNTLLAASQMTQTEHRQAAVCISCANIKDIKIEECVEQYSNGVSKPEEMKVEYLPEIHSNMKNSKFPVCTLNCSEQNFAMETECTGYNGDTKTNLHRSGRDVALVNEMLDLGGHKSCLNTTNAECSCCHSDVRRTGRDVTLANEMLDLGGHKSCSDMLKTECSCRHSDIRRTDRDITIANEMLDLGGHKSCLNTTNAECSCCHGDKRTSVRGTCKDLALADEPFFKPIDYYRSYKKLMTGLQTESPS